MTVPCTLLLVSATRVGTAVTLTQGAKDEVSGLDEGYRKLEQILGSLENER